MILPVYGYGTPVLRKVAKEIDKNFDKLNELIQNMTETMHQSDGVGLAAPQIGKSIRLFIIDASPLEEDDESLKDFKKTFINAQIIEEEGKEWDFKEGCLSLPGIREEVRRKPKIRIQYYDENFNFYDEYYNGIKARIIQHEHDHTEGILFTDRLSPLKKRLLKARLTAITKGKVSIEYKMKFAV
ncbi:MAG: peptide deformylase [Bacteroidales bacterium]|nr:peptide deformylase [Bacteroidales bacterium]